jgi:alpha-2-macroglobulin
VASRQAGRRLVRLDTSSQGEGWLFPSSVRAAARLFSATAMLDPRYPLLGALFESIIQTGRSASHWQWNTIEQTEVAEAIAAGRAVFGFGSARSVTVHAATGAVLATSRFASGRTDSASFVVAALGPAHDDTPSRMTLEADARAPIYYAATLFEMPRARPVRADDEGISVERWYESFTTGKPIVSVREGELVRVRLRVTMPRDREFVAITDPLPAGLEAVDLSLRTSSTLAPFAGAPRRTQRDDDAPPGGRWMYGSWDSGWWTPWDHKEIRDDRVHWFARKLWTGAFQISYVARATTAGVFVRPPAYAEEMYNPAVRGRSDGGWFTVESKR